jgi:hypothetical protein
MKKVLMIFSSTNEKNERNSSINVYLKNGSPKEKEVLLKEIETKEQAIENTQNYVKNNTRNTSKGRSW